jgi:hypothetical protein
MNDAVREAMRTALLAQGFASADVETMLPAQEEVYGVRQAVTDAIAAMRSTPRSDCCRRARPPSQRSAPSATTRRAAWWARSRSATATSPRRTSPRPRPKVGSACGVS